MDDFPVFDNFLSTHFGLTVNRERGEIVVFINSFTALLSTSDADIDDLVKSMHAMNSACPENEKIMIPASVIVALNDLRFELEDST